LDSVPGHGLGIGGSTCRLRLLRAYLETVGDDGKIRSAAIKEWITKRLVPVKSKQTLYGLIKKSRFPVIGECMAGGVWWRPMPFLACSVTWTATRACIECCRYWSYHGAGAERGDREAISKTNYMALLQSSVTDRRDRLTELEAKAQDKLDEEKTKRATLIEDNTKCETMVADCSLLTVSKSLAATSSRMRH
jgi:hypothetical protein